MTKNIFVKITKKKLNQLKDKVNINLSTLTYNYKCLLLKLYTNKKNQIKEKTNTKGLYSCKVLFLIIAHALCTFTITVDRQLA